MPRLLRSSSSVSRKEASIRPVRPLPHLGKNAETQRIEGKKKRKKKEDGKKRARARVPAGAAARRRKGDDGKKKESAGGSAASQSARWISAKFERALTREKCQSERKKNRGRERERGYKGSRGGNGETQGRVRDATVRFACTYIPRIDRASARALYTCVHHAYVCVVRARKCIYVFKIRRMREARGNANGGRSG